MNGPGLSHSTSRLWENSTTSKQQTSPKQSYGFKPSETPTLSRLSSFGHCIRKCSARFGVGRGNIAGQTRTLADHGMRFQCESRSFCGMSEYQVKEKGFS